MNEPSEPLVITGSFNDLMGRVAKIDFFDVWLTGKKILNKAKKSKIKPTMRMSDAQEVTGLTRGDVQFLASLGLISVIEQSEDPILSAREMFCIVGLFERFVSEGEIMRKQRTFRTSKSKQREALEAVPSSALQRTPRGLSNLIHP